MSVRNVHVLFCKGSLCVCAALLLLPRADDLLIHLLLYIFWFLRLIISMFSGLVVCNQADCDCDHYTIFICIVIDYVVGTRCLSAQFTVFSHSFFLDYAALNLIKKNRYYKCSNFLRSYQADLSSMTLQQIKCTFTDVFN